MSAYRSIEEEELLPFHQEVYRSADKITQYFILGYFVVGLGLAFFHNTWLLAVIMGSALLGIYFGLRALLSETPIFRQAVSLILWLYPLQFLIQMHGSSTMLFFYFVSLTVMLFYEDKWLLFPLIFVATFSYLTLFIGITDGMFLNLSMEKFEADEHYIGLQVGIMVIYAILSVLWANLQRKQTREAGINYIQMDEQLKLMEVNINFADNISQGDLDVQYPIDNTDRLGDSLINMRNSLRDAAYREYREKFVNVGLANIAEILRNHVDNLNTLSDKVIEKLVSYLKVNQGGIFILNENSDGEKYLELQACRAYERKKFQEKRIELGRGLLGQAALEKETIILSEIPEGYMNITSGLGISSPGHLIIIPLKSNEEVIGVVELASFKEFSDTDVEFLEKVSESIASTIISAKTNQQTKELLETSRQMTEEMQAQEEEMRQNMEEMQATQEEMARTQRELGEKEINLNALINNTDDSIITIDTDYNILIMNDKVKERYKGTQFEGMHEGSNALEMLGDVKDEWKVYYDRALAGERYGFVIQSSVKGEDTWREYFLNPIYDENKAIIGISVFSRDITDKKRAEQQLAHEQALFRVLLDNIPDALYFKDPESRFIKVSNSILENFGANSIEEVLGKSDFDFFGEEHARPAFEAERKIIETGVPILGHIEKEVRKNGRTTWAETFKMPLRDAAGNIIGTFGMSKDITASKEAEERVNERNNLLKGVIENTPDSIFTIDCEYNLILANKKILDLFANSGLKIKEGDKVPCDGNWKSYYDKALSGEFFTIEDNELSSNGKDKEVYLHIFGPVKNEENKIIGASIISRALSEHPQIAAGIKS